MKKAILYLTALLCAVCCVYPYDAEVTGEGGNLVVEGDIIVGGVSSFALSYLIPLGEEPLPSERTAKAQVWVESKDGKQYPATYNYLEDLYIADLSDADPSLEHRLYIKTFENREYYSDWSLPAGSCVIDDLSYDIVERNGEKQGVSIKMSFHSDDGSSHFRYRYTEDWEYTARWLATSKYDVKMGEVVLMDLGENYYYCWKKSTSRGINLATTETMGVNKLENYPLFYYGKSDEKISELYRLDLEIYPVPEISYRYLEHIKAVSNYSGDLFAPIPSEVRGNLHAVGDDDELVYGYVGTAAPQKRRLYIDNNETHLYIRPIDHDATYEKVPSEQWHEYYYKKYWRPYYNDVVDGIYWAPLRCVDCRYAGGTKEKPADWPNNHK